MPSASVAEAIDYNSKLCVTLECHHEVAVKRAPSNWFGIWETQDKGTLFSTDFSHAHWFATGSNLDYRYILILFLCILKVSGSVTLISTNLSTVAAY